MPRRRLDAELVRRGLVADRAEALEAIRSGSVTVGGAPVDTAASLVAPDQPVHVSALVRPFVSRGAAKLDAALSRFRIEARGRHCLDAGASTGGFTDRLLRGGAARVAAVDVGYGQLAWELRQDPRVRVLERTDIRDVTTVLLGFRPELVVVDLSFISLSSVVGALASVAAADAVFVALVKPQFEAGPSVGPGGVVRDPAAWREVLGRTVEAFDRAGIAPVELMASPLPGPAGNVEFLLHATLRGPRRHPNIDAAVAEGRAVAERRRVRATDQRGGA